MYKPEKVFIHCERFSKLKAYSCSQNFQQFAKGAAVSGF